MEKTKTNNRIGQDFTLMQLIRFALPAILTNLCAQLFKSLDDGLFVSRFVGPDALASISLLGPINCIIMSFAQLFSVGASTISAQKMGINDQQEAKRVFSRICIIGVSVGALIAVLMNVFCDPVCRFLGADDALIANSRIYVRIVHTNAPVNILVAIFSAYYATAGRPDMGLVCSILNGAMNIIFDIIFIAMMDMGVVGSSLSTIFGEIAVAIVGLFFYTRKKNEIYFVKPEKEYKNTFLATWKSGFSQFINSLSFSVTGFTTNHILLSVIGSDGVSANTVINDIRIIFNSAIVGFITCVGPVIAYNYGSRNVERLRKILTHYFKFWLFGSLIVTFIGLFLRQPLISIFFGSDTTTDLYKMTHLGLSIEMIAVLFSCGCILVMRMFVALGSPKTASILTVSRNFIIRMSMLLLLPWLFDDLGVWLAFPVSEAISCMVGAVIVIRNADNYGYGKSGIALRMMDEPLIKADA